MPASPFPDTLPVHPHQLEVQEFDSYALIVDLRPAEAFASDHIPRAVSVPWASQADLPIGTPAGVATAHLVTAVMEPAQRQLYKMEGYLESLDPGSAVLMYCDQGGALSAAAANYLVARGFTVDVIPGGWASYWRWINAGIELLARTFDWRWVRSSPGGISQALVEALLARGEQVLDVAGLFDAALMPGLVADPSSIGAPSLQSRLVDSLRRLDPGVPVWADEVIALSGEQVLPTPLDEALRQAEQCCIDASTDCRADLLLATLGRAGRSIDSILDTLADSMHGSFAATLGRLRKEGAAVAERNLLGALLGDVLDPLCASVAVSAGRGRQRSAQLTSGTLAAVDELAARLSGDQISP